MLSYRFKWWLIHIFSATLGVVIILSNLDSVINLALSSEAERWVPLEQDSFFHARRILDAAKNLANFYEFDTNVQGPEGAWLSYPWFYDYTMGLALKALIYLFPKVNHVEMMDYLPIGLFIINSMIFLAITGALELKLGYRLLACVCFALLPLNIGLHMVGHVDHHAAEYTFVLLTLWFGIEFFKHPQKKWANIGLAFSLAFAPGVQCGLIILQAWFLSALLLEWFLHKKLNDAYDIKLFLIAFSIANLLILLPSEPFRNFMFSLYLLSWFHLLVAMITGVVCWYAKKYAFNYKNLLKLLLLLLIISLPAVWQFKIGVDFIFNRIDYLKNTAEMQPLGYNTNSYTPLVLVFTLLFIPVIGWGIFLGGIWRYYFLIRLICGGFLMLLQHRFHYYANIALFLPAIMALDQLHGCLFKIKYKKIIYSVGMLMLVGAYIYVLPSWRSITKIPVEGQPASLKLLGSAWDYHLGFYLLNKLKSECLKDKGLVLADPHVGNYIRFHTECSVLSTRMLIAPQDIEKALRVQALFDGSQEEFLKIAEPIKYIFVNGFTYTQDGALGIQMNKGDGLQAQLLFGKTWDWEKNFKMLAEQHVTFNSNVGSNQLIWGRLFKVRKFAK